MSFSDIITLNVGGTRFETSRQTLMRFSESMLARMFDPESGLEPGILQNGAYFLDRDPKSFGMVLTFLRSGGIPPSVQEDKDFLWNLEKEADFFQLTELQEELLQLKKKEELLEMKKKEELLKMNTKDEILIFSTDCFKPLAKLSRTEIMKHPNTLLARIVDYHDLNGGRIEVTDHCWMARHYTVTKVDCSACYNPNTRDLLHSCSINMDIPVYVGDRSARRCGFIKKDECLQSPKY